LCVLLYIRRMRNFAYLAWTVNFAYAESKWACG